MKIGVITTSRADYGIYLPLLNALRVDSDFNLTTFVLGSHISKNYGYTFDLINSDPFSFVSANDSLLHGDDSLGLSLNMGETTKEMAKLVHDKAQDIYVCLGDRYEMMAAVLSIVPFNKPIIHIHGGERTEGAIDEKFRHALTKLSDLHFTSCEENRQRVIQMGEHPERVFNVGALGIADIDNFKILTPKEIWSKFGIDVKKKTLLGTYHPVTTQSEQGIDSFIHFLEETPYQVVMTLGNADTQGASFRNKVIKVGEKYPERIKVFNSLGVDGYFSIASYADVVIGNSSSGIMEMASLDRPVLNIGDRQKGRMCSNNVVHCGESKDEIFEGLSRALRLLGSKFDNVYQKEGTVALMLQNIKTFYTKYGGKPVYQFFDQLESGSNR